MSEDDKQTDEWLQRWKSVAAAVTMRSEWQIPMRWDVDRRSDGEGILHGTFEAQNIVTGEIGPFHFVDVLPKTFDPGTDTGRELAVDFIVRAIRNAVEHEFRECLLVDGERWIDPHKRDTP
jgi:hypothetical protein